MLTDEMMQEISARLDNPLARPPVPLFVFRRFVEPIFCGTKLQVLVPGRKIPVPWKNERFTLYYRDDDEERTHHVIADGIATESDVVMCYLEREHPSVELAYRYWDGESDCGEILRSPLELDRFAQMEGFRDWRALVRHSRKGERETLWAKRVTWTTLTLLPGGAQDAQR